MPVADSRRRANDKYNAKCGRIELRPLQADADAIKAAAEKAGQSIQRYILDAVHQRMAREAAAARQTATSTPDTDTNS